MRKARDEVDSEPQGIRALGQAERPSLSLGTTFKFTVIKRSDRLTSDTYKQ